MSNIKQRFFCLENSRAPQVLSVIGNISLNGGRVEGSLDAPLHNIFSIAGPHCYFLSIIAIGASFSPFTSSQKRVRKAKQARPLKQAAAAVLLEVNFLAFWGLPTRKQGGCILHGSNYKGGIIVL